MVVKMSSASEAKDQLEAMIVKKRLNDVLDMLERYFPRRPITCGATGRMKRPQEIGTERVTASVSLLKGECHDHLGV